jgi:TolB-like protein/Tfp pilus assembly protein PilF
MSAVYIISGWVVLQVADLLFPALEIREAALRYVWVAVLLGFPLALVFSWKYDITAQGIRRTPPRAEYAVQELSLRKSDYLLLTGLLVIAIFAVTGLAQRVIHEQVAIDIAPQTRKIDSNTIAVLPLENLSPDPEQAYFAVGMHDSLINNLSKVTGLRVTSRTSASRVDTTLTMPLIGRALGVARLIEGSIYREGNRVRVTVRLIDAASDQDIWAETYERDFSDVLSLQADVARSVAQAVQVQLTPQDEQSLARTVQIRPETFESYLRAMFQFRKETPKGYREGIEILEEALEKDPTSALAYAALSQGYSELGHSPLPPKGAGERARAAAEKAVELDDGLAEAHLALGMYRQYYGRDWAGAEVELKRVLELNPSLTDAWYHLAWLFELLGRDEEAIAAGKRTTELSPLSAFYSSWLADQYRDAEEYDKAIELAETVLELNPKYPIAWLALGNALDEQGRFEEAIEAHGHLAGSAFWFWVPACTYARAGQEDKTREVIDRTEHAPGNSFPLANMYASIGDTENALYWMDQVKEDAWYPWLVGWNRQFRRLHDDPLVIERAKELGIPLQGRAD